MGLKVKIWNTENIKQVLLGTCLMFSFLLTAQHNNNWALGFHKGITFNTRPTSLISTAICFDTTLFHINVSAKSSTSFSDCDGNLMIYGSGAQLWNRKHKPLKNGFFLGDNDFSSPIIPLPGSKRYLYYFYYYYGHGDESICGINKFFYAIIDMNGDGGLGEVIIKDRLLDSNMYGSNNITYTYHQNRKDIWIIHGPSSKIAKAYLLRDTGLREKPVLSSNIYSGNVCRSGAKFSKYRNAFFFDGQFKVTHDGNNLIASGIDSSTTKLGCCMMYDFDQLTGKLNNPKVLLKFSDIPIPPKTPSTDTFSNPPGNFYFNEIASNDTFIYFAGNTFDNRTSFIMQLNRYNFSKVYVKKLTKNEELHGLQIGPDSKIYSIHVFGGPLTAKLVCIDNPNLMGSKSNYKDVLSDSFIFTQNFPYVYQPFFKLYYTSNLDNNPCVDTATFNIHVDDFFRKVKVYYGDGDSVVIYPPLKPNYLLKHHYKTTGTFYFKLQGLNPDCDYYTTIADSVYVALVPKRYVLDKKASGYCGSSLLTVRDSFINTTNAIYKWQQGGADTLLFGSSPVNGIINKNFAQQNSPNKSYWQLSIGNKECPNYKTFNDSALLNYLPKTTVKFSVTNGSPKDSISSKNNKKLYSGCEPLKLIFTDSTANLKGGSIHWGASAGSATQYTNNNSPISNNYAAGNYMAIVNDTNTSGCAAADTFYITAWQLPKLQWLTGNLQQCFKGNLFDITNSSSGIQDSVNYILFWGDGDSTNLDSGSKAIHHFTQPKNYNTSLIAESKRGCMARIDTALVLYPAVNAQFNLNKDSQCVQNNQFIFTLKDTAKVSNSWSFGDATSASSIGQNPVMHTYAKDGNFTVQNITNSSHNCKDTATKTIIVLESPKANISLNDSVQCLPTNLLTLAINSSYSNTSKLQHTIDWGDTKQGSLTGNGNLNHVYSAIGSYSIKLTSKVGNCLDTTSKQLIVLPMTNLKLTAKGFCLGDTTVAKVLLVVANQYSWQINNNTIPETDSAIQRVFSSIGIYKIAVSAPALDCAGKDSLNISIIQKPKADFSYARQKDYNDGIPYSFTDLSANANTWFWQFGKEATSSSQNPNYSFKDTGYTKIKLRVSNQGICYDSTEKIIPVFDRIQFFFPNAFSPNGNGINDGFGLDPSQYYLVKQFHLEVFNRWGEKVFQSENVREQWIIPNTYQQGVYMFKVLVTDIYDLEQEISGAVQVLK